MTNPNEIKKRVEAAMNPGVIERTIARISPGWGVKRQKSRMFLALSGAYVGASRTRRSMKEWSVTQGDADTDLLYELPELRKRSRDLERNNAIAHGAIQTKCMNVIGPGLKLRPQLDREALGLTDEEADVREREILREWQLFWMSHETDLSRVCTGPEREWMGYKQAKVNGETLVLFPRRERGNFPYSTKIQLVESDRLCNEGNAVDTAELSSGVKKDSDGAPVEYHIMDQHPGANRTTKQTWTKVPAYGAKSGLRNVLHIYRMDRPNQTRGLPDLSAVIEILKQLGQYSEAEIFAAVLSGYFTVFVHSDEEDTVTSGPLNVFEPDGATVPADGSYKLGKGAVVGLKQGQTIDTANPGRPNANFDPFFQSMVQQIGVALGLPHEVLMKRFIASYSAARAALLEAWKYFTVEREWWALKFNQPIYEIFMYEAVASGRIAAPGFLQDPLIRQAWCRADWIGPAKGMINERDEVSAAQARVDMGISTLDEETAQLTGGDWEQKHPQRVKEVRMRREGGLDAAANELALARAKAGRGSDDSADEEDLEGDDDTEITEEQKP